MHELTVSDNVQALLCNTSIDGILELPAGSFPNLQHLHDALCNTNVTIIRRELLKVIAVEKFAMVVSTVRLLVIVTF